MDGPIIGYVRICDDPLTHGGNLDPICAQKCFWALFHKNFVIFLGPGTYNIKYS